MARVKRGVTQRARHKKVLDLAKGYVGRSSDSFRPALERVEAEEAWQPARHLSALPNGRSHGRPGGRSAIMDG